MQPKRKSKKPTRDWLSNITLTSIPNLLNQSEITLPFVSNTSPRPIKSFRMTGNVPITTFAPPPPVIIIIDMLIVMVMAAAIAMTIIIVLIGVRAEKPIVVLSPSSMLRFAS